MTRLVLNEPNQILIYENEVKASMYKSLNASSKRTKWVRFVGLPVGVASGIMTIIGRIVAIAENILKSCILIIQACKTRKSLPLKESLSQLKCIPLNLLLLPKSIALALAGIFIITFKVGYDPIGYTHNLWCNHDEKEASNVRIINQFKNGSAGLIIDGSFKFEVDPALTQKSNCVN